MVRIVEGVCAAGGGVVVFVMILGESRVWLGCVAVVVGRHGLCLRIGLGGID